MSVEAISLVDSDLARVVSAQQQLAAALAAKASDADNPNAVARDDAAVAAAQAALTEAQAAVNADQASSTVTPPQQTDTTPQVDATASTSTHLVDTVA